MEFKVGDKVKILGISFVENLVEKEIIGKTGTITQISQYNSRPFRVNIHGRSKLNGYTYEKSQLELVESMPSNCSLVENISGRNREKGEAVISDQVRVVSGIKEETGEKREFSTGAKKQDAGGKGTPVLFPPDAMLEIAKHFEGGMKIYGARNWEKGINLSEILNSLLRHIFQEMLGWTDERHDRAIAWNAVVYLATKLRIQNGTLPAELNDMPKYEQES